ncbi:MAG: TonB-dependent receptor [Candidatus Eremiobacteraeota bacterium]|nr:TonB-dependent receptor [Candidatus Eremiobacteraeota bacterium]
MTRVSGSVVSTQGAPVADAQLAFERKNTVTRSATKRDGTFSTTLAPGEYRLSASAIGFRPITRGFVVETSPVALTLQLSPASGSLIEIGRVGINSTTTLSTSSNVAVELNPQLAALRGVERVSDMLAQEIGVTAVRPNGGSPTLPFLVALRGPDPSETLIDIDGHEVNNSNTGDFDLSLLDPSDLSGVELLYGIAPSSLVGPNTIGGAINLRTLEPTTDPHGLLRTSIGSYNTFASTIEATGTQDRLGYAFSLHRLTSQGELHNRTIIASDGNGDITPELVSSDAVAASAFGKLRYGFRDGAFLQLTARDQSSNRDQSAGLSVQNDDGTFTAFSGATVGAHSSAYGLDFYTPLGSRNAVGTRDATLLLRHYISIFNQSVDGPIADNGSAYFFNNRDRIIEDSLEYNRYYEHGSLTLKANIRTESLTEPFASLSSGGIIDQAGVRPTAQRADAVAPTLPLTQSAVQRSFALRYATEALRNVQLTLAAYYSRFSTVGSSLDPRLGVVWAPNRRSVVRASVGSTFQAPQLTELFVPSPLPTPPPDGFVSIGNPALRAEHATEYQLGYEHLFGSDVKPTRVSLDLYQTNLRNAINPFVSEAGYIYPINVGNAVYRGFELRFDHSLTSRIHLTGGYSTNSAFPISLPAAVGDGSLVSGQQFLGTPLHRIDLGVHGDSGHGISFEVGALSESGNNELNRPPFATLRASISVRGGPLLFTLSGTNLTNVYADGFTRDGAGVSYPGLTGPIATPAFALPARQLTLSVTRTY